MPTERNDYLGFFVVGLLSLAALAWIVLSAWALWSCQQRQGEPLVATFPSMLHCGGGRDAD